MQNRRKVVSIFGQTASGKSELIQYLSRDIDLEVINVDSVQVYRGLDIGSAKPDFTQLQQVKHHLVSCVDLHEDFSVFDFVESSLKILPQVFMRQRIPFLCGGTPFYFLNLLYGTPNTPKVSENTKEKVRVLFENEDLDLLYDRFSQIDPQYAKIIHKNDSYRLKRAFEIYFESNLPVSKFRNFYQVEQNEFSKLYESLNLGIFIQKEELHARIDSRVHSMIEKGLLEEVERLFEEGRNKQNTRALGSIGYVEFFQYNDIQQCKANLKNIINLIATHTRQYAKRQKTFFSKIKDAIWMDINHKEEIKNCILKFLES